MYFQLVTCATLWTMDVNLNVLALQDHTTVFAQRAKNFKQMEKLVTVSIPKKIAAIIIVKMQGFSVQKMIAGPKSI